MAEYIEREAVLALLGCRVQAEGLIGEAINEVLAAAEKAVKKLTAADVVEVRHGKWGKEKWTHTDQHICSLCHSTVRVHPQSVEYKYCPYCGVIMDGVTDICVGNKTDGNGDVVTCLNCKHLMFSDMYGECNKQLRIVNPSDTCEYAEPKEVKGADE